MKRYFVIKHCWLFVAAGALALPQAGAQALKDTRSAAVIDDLVNANRILFSQGIVDGFGHISARSPIDPRHFFMARSIAPSDVKVADIMEFDSDGKVIGEDPRQPYAERYIHSEIYKSRPEIMSVVHAHSAAVIPFSITGVPLMPVYHMSGFLGKGAPVFDVRDTSPGNPDSDLLVKNDRLGAQLAEKLGTASVVLMRGHGFTAVGSSVSVAVFRSVYTEQNARIQSESLKLGTPKFLTVREAQMTQETMERLSGRAWEMWKKQADQVR